MNLISTIIPVYNAEAFLAKCLDALTEAQNAYPHTEIILINDGSTDASLSICNQYAEQYDFIKVCTQVNQGPSAARNHGIQVAQGEWITFVDSDDIVVPNYYKTITENLSDEFDVMVFGYKKVRNGQSQSFSMRSEMLDAAAIQHKIYTSSQNLHMFWFPFSKVYRAELIKKVSFNDKIIIGADTIFNLNVFAQARKIKIIEDCLYCYVTNGNSLTQAKYRHNLLQNMINHYNARKQVGVGILDVKSSAYKRDIANYYINHILFWLFKNVKNAPDAGSREQLLSSARESIIYVETFNNYKYNWKHPKRSLLIKLFELRKFKLLLRLITSNKSINA